MMGELHPYVVVNFILCDVFYSSAIYLCKIYTDIKTKALTVEYSNSASMENMTMTNGNDNERKKKENREK